MAERVVDIVQEKIVPIIQSLGYEVLEIEYAKKNDGMNLSFIIDQDGGIKIEDCESVHKAIEGPLDEINPTADKPYILNVCSAGLDRPISTNRDFLRNKGKNVEVKLYSPQNGQKSFVGELLDFNEKIVKIKIENKELEFDRKIVAIINPIIEF